MAVSMMSVTVVLCWAAAILRAWRISGLTYTVTGTSPSREGAT